MNDLYNNLEKIKIITNMSDENITNLKEKCIEIANIMGTSTNNLIESLLPLLTNTDSRKIELLNGEIHTYMRKNHFCKCGSNCFHLENSINRTYGVCNACNKDIYEYEFEEFKEWRYR